MITSATITHGLGGVFLAYALLSSVLLTSSPGSWQAHLVGLAIAYVVGTSTAYQRTVWLGILSILCLFLGVTLLGYYINIFTVAGLFGNPNWLGVTFALALIAALAYRLFWFVPIGIFAVWWSSSRAAIVCTAVTATAMLWPKFRLAILTIAILALTVFMYKEDKATSFMIRLGVWQDTLEHLTILGSGWGSFATEWARWPVHRNATMLIVGHAYNDPLELLFCLGIGAIPLFLLVIFTLDQPSSARPIIGCFVLLGLTYFPFWIPGVAHMFAFALGTAVKEAKGFTYTLRPVRGI